MYSKKLFTFMANNRYFYVDSSIPLEQFQVNCVYIILINSTVVVINVLGISDGIVLNSSAKIFLVVSGLEHMSKDQFHVVVSSLVRVPEELDHSLALNLNCKTCQRWHDMKQYRIP